jgi:hypothetical protein
VNWGITQKWVMTILVLGIALLSLHTYTMKLKYTLHLNSLSASSNAYI